MTDMIKFIDTIRELITYYTILILACAIAYSHFEGETFLDSLWWACVTAMTVGYGDLYPQTAIGKVIAVFLMHVSVLFILPLLICLISNKCTKDENQEFMKAHILEIEKLLKER